jgi:hypothetical protein
LSSSRQNLDIKDIYKSLTNSFSEEEIKLLCFELGVDYDELLGSGKSNKIRDLIQYCQRRQMITPLIESINSIRPNSLSHQGRRKVFTTTVYPRAFSILNQSRLALDISNQIHINIIKNIWKSIIKQKIEVEYISKILVFIDSFIPESLFDKLTNEERFLLITSVVIDAHINYNFAKNSHDIFEHHFKNLFQSLPHICECVYEIIKARHGVFEPAQITTSSYQIPQLALLFRLVHLLQFDVDQPPAWIFDKEEPASEVAYWLTQNKLYKPLVDSRYFRIEIRGELRDREFIKRVRSEFENSFSASIQNAFFSRGGHGVNYIIRDLTSAFQESFQDQKDRAIYEQNQYFLVASYLYDLSNFELAKEYFEMGKLLHDIQWHGEPLKHYIYYYLKTLNGLGLYDDVITLATTLIEEINPTEEALRADILNIAGMSAWKSSRLDEGLIFTKQASALYGSIFKLSNEDRYCIATADSLTLQSIIALERFRLNLNEVVLLDPDIEEYSSKALLLYNKFHEKHSRKETHFMGRFYGLKAFAKLAELESKHSYNPSDWNEALDFVVRAYGGQYRERRNRYGLMAGMYCEAAVLFHMTKFASLMRNTLISRLTSALSSIEEAEKIYKDIYGQKNIRRTRVKIIRLKQAILSSLCEILPKDEEYLIKFKDSILEHPEIDDRTILFTSLN